MPRLADEDRAGEEVPCVLCFEKIKHNRDHQCLPPPPTGRGTRCENCTERHRECKAIPQVAQEAVKRMLDMRRQFWMGRITEEDFEYWYAQARQTVSDAKRAQVKAESSPVATVAAAAPVPPVPALPAQRPQALQPVPAKRRRSSPERSPRAAPTPPRPVVSEETDGDSEDMDIDNMGVAATLHAILRTLIKIDRRMERLEARI